MQLPGIVTVKPEQTDTIERLSLMMGKSFMEELWTEAWLEALDPLKISDARKLEISQAIMKYDFTMGAPYRCCHMLPDMAAATGGYLSSDLAGRTWAELEEEAFTLLAETALTEQEAEALASRADKMKAISNFSWMVDHAHGTDFIHFFSIGVNLDMRGSGAFRKLMTPFFDYADQHDIACYLECYRDSLEGLYKHFGFETIYRFSDPAFDIVERSMIRTPR